MPTDKQQKVFEFIKKFIAEHGYSPTLRDISDHFRFSGPSSVVHHVIGLEKKGLISREPNIARSIRVLDKESET